MSTYDVIIVGGGPAGLSAAAVLGRCRRRVLVVDAGKPRNYAARHMHNYLTRDGCNPREFLGLAREEIDRYGVEYRHCEVAGVTCLDGDGELCSGFGVKLVDGSTVTCRKILFATGVRDELPNVHNLKSLYGAGVHHCPYCDAYEYTGQPIGAYGRGRPAVGLALSLLTWSKDVTVVTDGNRLKNRDRREAALFGIQVREEPVTRLDAVLEDGSLGDPRPGSDDRLARIVFESGATLEVKALFFNTDQAQRSNLPLVLGCKLADHGGIRRDNRQRTGVKNLYVAGDASRDVQFVIVAAAEGAKAGVTINKDFQEEDRAQEAAAVAVAK